MPRLDVVGMIVSDIERAIAFYERVGLRFQESPDPKGHGHAETTLPGGLRFTLDKEVSIRSFDPGWLPRLMFPDHAPRASRNRRRLVARLDYDCDQKLVLRCSREGSL